VEGGRQDKETRGRGEGESVTPIVQNEQATIGHIRVNFEFFEPIPHELVQIVEAGERQGKSERDRRDNRYTTEEK
jgi:hypothetical protein